MVPGHFEKQTDAELLAGVATARGSEAFAAFYCRHEALVLAYLRRRVPRSELAADLAAETFAAALEHAGRFDAGLSRDGQAAGWLLTIAHRELLTALRRGRVADQMRRKLAMTQPLLLVDEALARVDELASLPERLDELVDALPANLRAAVLARVVAERTYENIAADLRCSELVARQRVSRGLARLRHQLAEDPS